MIATKVFYPMSDDPNDRGLSRKHILASIDGSLRRLGTDYVDLYQIHRWDPETPIEETLEALHDVVRAGKARYIGASSMFAWQFAKALYLADRHGWTRFVSMQNHYNLVYREEEREMLPLCREEGIGVIPWSPLARGFLAGNRSAADKGVHGAREDRRLRRTKLYYADSDFRIVDRVVEVADARGVAPAQIALAVGSRQAGRDRADRRRLEDGAARSGDRRARPDAQRRGAPPARRAVRAAPGGAAGRCSQLPSRRTDSTGSGSSAVVVGSPRDGLTRVATRQRWRRATRRERPLDVPWNRQAGFMTRVMASMSRAKLDSVSPSCRRPARVSAVVARPAVVDRVAPLRGDQPLELQALQRRIERSLFDVEHVVRHLADCSAMP